MINFDTSSKKKNNGLFICMSDLGVRLGATKIKCFRGVEESCVDKSLY